MQQAKLRSTMNVLLEVEFILNNRPFTYVYRNELEECVTPNHLVYDQKVHLIASPTSTLPNQSNRPQNHQIVVYVINHF